jgi:hypothetical protein
MGALGNAASLMTSQEWKNWMTAAASFVAAEVYAEADTVPEHAARLRLALDVLNGQPDMITSRLLTLVSTTASVASVGPTPSDAHEAPVLARVRQLWTPIAKSYYPPEQG